MADTLAEATKFSETVGRFGFADTACRTDSNMTNFTAFDGATLRQLVRLPRQSYRTPCVLTVSSTAGANPIDFGTRPV